jgi:D-glycero-D-manno-heptose 1,7-bisphosphate phosphatase
MSLAYQLEPLYDRDVSTLRHFPKGVIVFDRDGTLVEDAGQHNRKAMLSLLPGVPEGLKFLSELGFGIAVASNQAGLESEKFTLKALRDFNLSMRRVLQEQVHIDIDLIVICPHLALSNCACRKPKSGLLIAIEASGLGKIKLFVGDSESDAGAAKDFGVEYLQTDGTSLVNLIKTWAGKNAFS